MLPPETDKKYAVTNKNGCDAGAFAMTTNSLILALLWRRLFEKDGTVVNAKTMKEVPLVKENGDLHAG